MRPLQWFHKFFLCAAVVLTVSATANGFSGAISGQVIDEQGQAVEDAEVVVIWAEPCPMMLINVELAGRTRTDAQGRFALETDILTDTQLAAALNVVAYKEPYAVASEFFELPHDHLPAQYNLVLEAGTTTSGRIVDQAGNAISGAQVQVLLAIDAATDEVLFNMGHLDALNTTTDEDGIFRYDNLPANMSFELLVSKDGFAIANSLNQLIFDDFQLSLETGSDDIEITLSEPEAVGGVITDADGQPVAGARVLLSFNEILLAPINTTTDEHGRWDVDNLGPGDYVVVVEADAGSNYVNLREQVVISRDHEGDLNFQMVRAGTLEVLVKHRDTGEAVPNAQVNVRPTEGSMIMTSGMQRADSSGKAGFDLRPGEYEVRVFSSSGIVMVNAGPVAVVEQDQVSTVEVMVRDRPGMERISGIVYDLNGEPMPDVQLRMIPSHLSSADVRSDAKGEFSFSYRFSENDRQYSPFVLVARYEQRKLAAMVEFTENDSHLELHLKPGITILGQVVDPAGEPIAEAEVILRVIRGNLHSNFAREPFLSDAQGRIWIPAIPAEQLRLSLAITGQEHGTDRLQCDTADAVNYGIDVGQIQLPEALFSVSGKVVDTAGNPVSGVRINSSGWGQPRRTVTNNADGRFTIKNLVQEQVHIYGFASGAGSSMWGDTTTMAGADDVVLVVMSSYERQRPAGLAGSECPDMQALLGEQRAGEFEDKAAVVCFVDVQQRGARHFLSRLADYAEDIDGSDIAMAIVQIESIDDELFSMFTSDLPFEVERPSETDQLRQQWQVRGSPWIVVIDSERTVLEEGIAAERLFEVISEGL